MVSARTPRKMSQGRKLLTSLKDMFRVGRPGYARKKGIFQKIRIASENCWRVRLHVQEERQMKLQRTGSDRGKGKLR